MRLHRGSGPTVRGAAVEEFTATGETPITANDLVVVNVATPVIETVRGEDLVVTARRGLLGAGQVNLERAREVPHAQRLRPMPRHFGGIGENGTYLRLTTVNQSVHFHGRTRCKALENLVKAPRIPVGVVTRHQVADALPRYQLPRIHACPPLVDGTQQLESHCDTGRSSPAVAVLTRLRRGRFEYEDAGPLLLSENWKQHSDKRTPPELRKRTRALSHRRQEDIRVQDGCRVERVLDA